VDIPVRPHFACFFAALPAKIPPKPIPFRNASSNEVSASQLFGLLWAQQQSSGVLGVPSAMMGTDWPTERNYVINPQHRRFSSIKIYGSETIPV